jgi:hypothetical protein
MNQFLKKSFVYFLGVTLLAVIVYNIIDYNYNHISEKNTLFIWGDSQAYKNINLARLEKHFEKKIYSAANQGAGVYDFLVFVAKVPAHAEVLISLSKSVLVRRKNQDFNSTGLSISGLNQLYHEGYTFSELREIVDKNLKPKALYKKEIDLHPNSDTLCLSEPLWLFEKVYKKVPLYLENKKRIMLYGLNLLKQKNCKINFIEFPLHPILQRIERNSPIFSKTEQFKKQVLDMFSPAIIDTIYLDKQKNIMYDLTHFNTLGASEFSDKFGSIKFKKNRSTLYIVHWNDLNDNSSKHKKARIINNTRLLFE